MSPNTIDKVLVVTSEAFPHGMAGTNRIISLCKGFQANGLEAFVISFFKYGEPGETALNLTSGSYEGVPYKNVFRSTVKSRWKIMRIIHELLKSLLVFKQTYNAINSRTVVIYYSNETGPAISLRIVTKLKGSLLIKDETEHPRARVKEGFSLSRFIFFRYHYSLFDSLTVITNGLYSYFITDVGLDKPVFILPMIVDVDRFNEPDGPDNKNIVFSGVLNEQKEGVGMLIRAFSAIATRYPELTLDLYGKAFDPDEEAHYRNLIVTLELGNKVMMHGYRTRNEMTKILSNARLLAFTRPPSKQATYGFSTKLGEYLATGKPVLATKAGEIEQFLMDRENAFLCEAEDKTIASKICEILDDYDFALRIGNKGKLCALKNFNNKTETKRMLDQIRAEFRKDPSPD